MSAALREIVETWAKKQIAGEDKVNVDLLVRSARDILGSSPKFQAAALDFVLSGIVPRTVRAVVREEHPVKMGVYRTSRAALASKLRDDDKWAQWRRRYIATDADNGREVELPDMTKGHLNEAMAAHREAARESLVGAGFLKRLADEVGDDGETVSSVFTPDELDRIMSNVEARFAPKGD